MSVIESITDVRDGDKEERLTKPGEAEETFRESFQMEIIWAVMDQTPVCLVPLPR